jgi:hypothetical protein
MVFALRAVRLPTIPGWLLGVAEAERGRFMPWLAVFMAAGVLGYFILDHEPPLYAGPVLLLGAAGLVALLRAPDSPPRNGRLSGRRPC